jgi:hypothetical protein
MRTGIAYLAATVSIAFCVQAAAQTCQYEKGEARWEIKTSVPQGSDLLKASKIELRELIELENPQLSASERKAIQSKRWSGEVQAAGVSLHEGYLVSVAGYLYRSRCQKDGDYHLEIGFAPARADASCLIVEIPDPDQISDEQLKSMVQAARDALESNYSDSRSSHSRSKPPRIRIVGQLFLDETHSHPNDPGGGRGTLLASGRHCATNVWEIHPVMSLGAADAQTGE